MKSFTKIIVLFVWGLLLTSPSATAQINIHERFSGIENVKISEIDGKEIAHLRPQINLKIIDKKHSSSILNRLGVQFEKIVTPFDTLGWGVIQVKSNSDIFQLIKQLNEYSDVLAAEPLYVGDVGLLPNDPELSRQWSLINTGQSPTNGTTGADIFARVRGK